ncbi:MAG: hypothetical protein PHG27_09695 [Massilibacteroides sp.]|nr:hypothetical protein [Massilibacteroides sp.]
MISLICFLIGVAFSVPLMALQAEVQTNVKYSGDCKGIATNYGERTNGCGRNNSFLSLCIEYITWNYYSCSPDKWVRRFFQIA